ncbi:hypothetical protein CYMTET_3819 [Cymbomonas tetramitiformis]|uniref:J domain-containing protein n=1 Tax=Cymbomonas tetramitiformis TaxID=36881 RepID=A0AAE0H2D3_9CHLO|nr:hypothetical protein CYMTET_3819 [Cymbomonas tetramitiformis]
MCLSTRECYAILGLESGASQSELKEAYRQLALKHHPDRTGLASGRSREAFHRATTAYKILSSRRPRFGASPTSTGFAGSEEALQQADILNLRKWHGSKTRRHFSNVKLGVLLGFFACGIGGIVLDRKRRALNTAPEQ